MTGPTPNSIAPTNTPRRPSAGWGPSRLSTKRQVMRQDAIGSSLRWSDGVCGDDISLRPLPLGVNTLMFHSCESGNLWANLSVNWFAQRHEGSKRLLCVFVSSCELKSFYARQDRTIYCPDGHYIPRLHGNDNVAVLERVNPFFRRPSAGKVSTNMKTTRK